jgi:hypothetical protein
MQHTGCCICDGSSSDALHMIIRLTESRAGTWVCTSSCFGTEIQISNICHDVYINVTSMHANENKYIQVHNHSTLCRQSCASEVRLLMMQTVTACICYALGLTSSFEQWPIQLMWSLRLICMYVCEEVYIDGR